MTDNEAEYATEMDGLYVIELGNPDAQTEGSKADYTSNFSTRLSKDEIRKILRVPFS